MDGPKWFIMDSIPVVTIQKGIYGLLLIFVNILNTHRKEGDPNWT